MERKTTPLSSVARSIVNLVWTTSIYHLYLLQPPLRSMPDSASLWTDGCQRQNPVGGITFGNFCPFLLSR